MILMEMGCDSGPSPTLLPIEVKWNFADGIDGWRTLYPEEADIVRDGDVVCLCMHKMKLLKRPSYDGGMWKMIHLDKYKAKRVSMLVVAKAATSQAILLSLGIACQTGKQNGPTYGVLAADGVDYHLTADWTTYSMTLEIPEGTREVQLSVSISAPKSDDASMHIRSVEYLVDG